MPNRQQQVFKFTPFETKPILAFLVCFFLTQLTSWRIFPKRDQVASHKSILFFASQQVKTLFSSLGPTRSTVFQQFQFCSACNLSEGPLKHFATPLRSLYFYLKITGIRIYLHISIRDASAETYICEILFKQGFQLFVAHKRILQTEQTVFTFGFFT